MLMWLVYICSCHALRAVVLFLAFMLMLFIEQLRRMQEMIAKMQAQMQKQGDEGDGPHV